ncbi:aminoacyl-tRNA deacylase [Candidatus Nanosalina sp. VS9-1]|uniref:aminoacyl-tRNA deacylase n=1 Tax=Candidatus Nanosalina sp. VS9-1 TaxID=3388566 RepID=UPI0039E17789
MKGFTQTPEEMEEFAEFIEEDIENVQRVIGELMSEDIDAEFMVHAKAETVEESAENTDMEAENIIKTLVFIGEEPVAVLCPGDTSVSEEKLEKILGSEVRMAKPGEVTEATGYIVGGVSPFDLDIKVLMEESILEKERVKPAAGSRVVGVSINVDDLKEITDPDIVDVSR